ncbi:MAG TPA: dienelactone hydrolase family protein [Kofleriaceae bacterium]|jgi:dienelactone hydrolase
MQNIFVAPAGDIRGGLVVCHGGTGLGDHERALCERFAELGFAAFAPDLFGEKFRDRAHAMAIIGALVAEPTELRARMMAAHRALRQRVGDAVPVAAVGHCFGGLAVLELARSGADVRAVASVHGGLATQARATQIHARVLICTGAADPHANGDARAAICDELEAAGADWQMLVLGGARHGFTQPGDSYDPAADRRWWRALLGLLDEVMPAVAPLARMA